MANKTNLVLIVLLLLLVFSETGLCQSQSQYALIQIPVFENPLIWKLTKYETNTLWGVDLFGNQASVAQSYVMTPDYELWSGVSFHLDNVWNRMTFQECLDNWIFGFGEPGAGVGQFLWPSRVDAHALCGWWGSNWYYDYFYYIFVADACNDRIVELRYHWGYQTLEWLGTITGGGLDFPEDLDINNGETFLPNSDDYLWVLNGHEIKRFTLDGVLRKTYGSYGCDGADGHFCRPTAVVCGRHLFAFEPHSNNNCIYVANDGNKCIVLLWKSETGEDITWIKEVPYNEETYIVDLEADNFGQVWAVDRDNGRIYKYTYDLYPLCYYGSFGTGENQFYYPLSVSSHGGYLGCGDVFVAESWTDNSGGQYFAIGTDIVDFEVTSSVDYRWHYINYTLVDPSDVTIEIYDEEDQLVKTLFDAIEWSGACTHVWDGTNQSGQQVGTGAYRAVVTDSCNYGDPETQQPTNVVVKEGWFHHDGYLRPPWNLAGYQSGADEITLEWEYPQFPDDWVTVYCDGCLCGAVEPLVPRTYTDSGLIPDQSYIYWVRAYRAIEDTSYVESGPSNADTVFLESKLLFPSASDIFPVDQSFSDPASSSKQEEDTCDVRIIYTTAYPGHFTEVEVMLENPVAISGFNFLIKPSSGHLFNFHTERIFTDSILIDPDWVHYPVRECWIDTSGSLISGFSSVTCRGQVADTTLPHCKYLWVKAWAPPDEYIPPDPSYRTLFKFGVDAFCIPDSTNDRTVRFNPAFGRVYSREYEEIPLRCHPACLTLWWSVPGDASGDSLVDMSDILWLSNYLYKGGPAPCIPETGDPSGDCLVDLSDILYLICYLYKGGAPPNPGCWYGKK